MFHKMNQLTGHKSAIYALARAENDKHFLTGAGDGWVADWDLAHPDTGVLLANVNEQIFSLCLLSGRNRLVIGNMNGGVHWVDLADPDGTRNVAHHKMGVYAILEWGEYVLTAGGEGLLTRWHIDTGRTQDSFHLSNQSLRCLDCSPERNELAIGASDHAIYLVDATTLELIRRIPQAHQNSVFSVRYAPGGQYLFSGGRDAHLNVWDLENGCEKVSSQPAHWYTINDIVFHPNGQMLATASRDKTIKFWDARDARLLKVLEGARDGGHFHSVNRLLWMQEGEILLSASDDRTVIIWHGSPFESL